MIIDLTPKVDKKAPLGKAIHYWTRQQPSLCAFLDDGRFPIVAQAARGRGSVHRTQSPLEDAPLSRLVLDAPKILGRANVTITPEALRAPRARAWEHDYHRVAFTLPQSGTVYVLTKRKAREVRGEKLSRDRARVGAA